jgi:hypothetical protein
MTLPPPEPLQSHAAKIIRHSRHRWTREDPRFRAGWKKLLRRIGDAMQAAAGAIIWEMLTLTSTDVCGFNYRRRKG